MSFEATSYALAVLDGDDELTETPRFVLLLLAARINGETGVTFTGGWLERAGGPLAGTRRGWHRSTIWRAIGTLEAAGYIAVHHRPGLSSIVAVPGPADPQKRANSYPQPVALPRQSADATRRATATDPSRRRDRPVAPARRVSNPLSNALPGASDTANGCERCDGTSFVSDEIDGVWQSSPCDCHPSRQPKAGRR